jgi:NTP pyrophosphatase (non-canonical NTP hydrolase)
MTHPAVTRLAERNMTAHEITARAAARRDGPPPTLAALADVITAHLRERFPASTEQHQQVLGLAEETGEFVGAYRRWAGMARRTGTWDDVTAERADVVITAYVTAHVLGIDLDAAWRAKARTVLTRGWREPPTPAA